MGVFISAGIAGGISCRGPDRRFGPTFRVILCLPGNLPTKTIRYGFGRFSLGSIGGLDIL
jgi:hypothetical protein